MISDFCYALLDTCIILTFGVSVPILLAGCYYFPTILLPIVVPYSLYCMVSGSERKGTPWEWFSKNGPFKRLREYFPLKLIVSAKLKESEQSFVFAVHPHGVASDWRVLMDGMIYDALPNLKSWRTLGASVLFRLPVVREFCLWTHVVDASRPVAEKVMQDGNSVFVLPGGEREQLMTTWGKEIVFIKSRMGFIRLSLKFGYPLVPVYVFGCNDLYRTSSVGYGLRLWIVKNLGICLPLFWGRFGLMSPFKVPINIVFGDPLEVSAPDPNPSREATALKHEEFIAALKKLFDENKAIYGFGDRELEIR